MLMKNGFHNLVDQKVRTYQTFTSAGWVFGTYITVLNRSLAYQFFPHFHPYVGGNRSSLANVPASWLSLIQRLQEGGTGELLDSDTLYMPQPNPPTNGQPLQPLTVTPNSTRIVLAQNTSGTRPDGTTVALNAGTPLTLNDLITVVIPAQTVVGRTDGSNYTLASDSPPLALPGNIPISTSSGVQWSISGIDSIVPDNTLVSIKAAGGAQAVLTNDGTSVTLPDATKVLLSSGDAPTFLLSRNSSAATVPTHNTVQHPYPVKNLDFTTTAPTRSTTGSCSFMLPS